VLNVIYISNQVKKEEEQKMKMFNRFSLLFLFIFLVCHIGNFLNGSVKPSPRLFLGTQSGTTGAVRGLVKDAESGKVIAKAKIVLVNSKNSTMKYELQTDKKGAYYKGGLRPGYYEFTVEKEDFLPISKTVRARLGETVQEDFELQSLESQVPEAITKAKKAIKFFQEAKWEDAVKEFSKAIAENQSSHMLFYFRGIAQEKFGNLEEAMSDYQKTIELKPDFALPYSMAGKIFARQQNYKKASEFYQKSVELDDQDITTLYNYAVVLINIGEKSDEAIVILEKLLSLDEEHADAYYRLGMLYVSQGDTERAKELLLKFLELDPENKNATIARQVLDALK